MKYMMYIQIFLITVCGLLNAGSAKETKVESPMQVDFSYAFSAPHRLAVSLPDNSNKTLVDVFPDYVRLKWSYENLLSKPLASLVIPNVNWEIRIKPEIDGKAYGKSHWRRAEGWLPVVETVYEESGVTMTMQIVSSVSATIVKVNMQNTDGKKHQVAIRSTKPGGRGKAHNPAWVQSDWNRDVLLAAYRERADRILGFVIGGDEHPVIGPATVSQVWQLDPGEQCIGWIIQPYKAYHSQLSTLKRNDWNAEFEAGKETWRQLIGRAAQVIIADMAVQNAYYAGLADCFVMREPVSDEFICGTPGSEKYRSASSGEPAMMSILLDQVGLHKEAATGLQMCIELQAEDGNWADPKGWAHYIWGVAGIKAWAVMEHYRLTGDKAYLEEVYPRMLACSRWQELQRAKTRKLENGKRQLTYGLMPRGKGDCGLLDGDDQYGVFLPHNFLAVFADDLTIQAAEILGKTADLPELRRIYKTALNDLRQALKKGSIQEDDYRWIPGVAGKTDGSRWGALYASYPCNILPRNHELIDGTIRKLESYISPGGIPVNTGWLKDGLWVAIALDNLAEVQLYRDEADAAIRYLYATLNHGTPLYSWCEERGQEPGSKQCTGDLQHLWTPLAVSRFIRDALVMEDGDTLHLARGTARQWFDDGQSLGVRNMVTHFGVVSYRMVYDEQAGHVNANIELPDKAIPCLMIHLRLPDKRKIKSVESSVGAKVSDNGSSIIMRDVRGQIHFEAGVK